MEKKVLKMYETPALQVVELEMKTSILVGSKNAKENPFSDSTYEGEEDE